MHKNIKMKRNNSWFLLFFILYACGENYEGRNVIKLTVEKYRLDSTSIRAIEIINDSSIVYAGSRAEIGIVSESQRFIAPKKVNNDNIGMEFRALAHTNSAVYALSIENPAMLYQYKDHKFKLVYSEKNEKVFYDSMRFFDDLNGIAMGDPTEGCLSIIVTNDGGNTWKKINCENLPPTEEGEAAFAASDTNIAIYGKNAWIATGGKAARVFHTQDMGVTWEVYNTPIIQGKETTGIYSIDFYNDKQGIIGGGDYTDKYGISANKAITKNGGITWELVAIGQEPHYISCVQYVPETQGKEIFSVSTNGVFFSNNSGLTWNKVYDEGFYSIRLANKNKAWLSGFEKIAKMNID
jgi:hypothetical protein